MLTDNCYRSDVTYELLRLWISSPANEPPNNDLSKDYANDTQGRVPLILPSCPHLPHINWITKNPTASAAQIVAPGFHSINAAFGRAVGTGLGISPYADRLSILQ
jgi:hypothetical protein